MKTLYLVYRITNKTNNKVYIGVHKTSNIDDGYMGSSLTLKEDIKNIGINNFKKEILFIFDNAEEMLLKERHLVDDDFVKSKDTYNLMLGGGFFCGELTKDTIVVRDIGGNKFRIDKNDDRYLKEFVPVTKGHVTVKDKNNITLFVSIDDSRYISGELKPIWSGRKKSEESKNKIRGSKNPFYGKSHTTETKSKISAANKLNIGELNHFYGKHHTEETIEKLREIGIKLHKDGKNKGFFGGKHTEESKLKMSQVDRRGDKNSQFGTCWINNTDLRKNKKIKKEELETWTQNGWIKGMNKKFFKNKIK